MVPWNPGQYLQFGQERTRAAAELCARIPLAAPRRVLDLGCGPATVPLCSGAAGRGRS